MCTALVPTVALLPVGIKRQLFHAPPVRIKEKKRKRKEKEKKKKRKRRREKKKMRAQPAQRRAARLGGHVHPAVRGTGNFRSFLLFRDPPGPVWRGTASGPGRQ